MISTERLRTVLWSVLAASNIALELREKMPEVEGVRLGDIAGDLEDVFDFLQGLASLSGGGALVSNESVFAFVEQVCARLAVNDSGALS